MGRLIVRQFPNGRILHGPAARGSIEADRRRRRENPTPTEKRAIKERDNYTCQRCGSTDRSTLTVDHDVPVAKGGTKDPSNLITLCTGCQHWKADRLDV